MASLLGCTVAELGERISAHEISEWREFYDLEPWGWDSDCYAAGIVAATIANVHRDTKKRQQPFSPAEFLPGYKKPKKSADVLKAEFTAMFAGMKKRGGQTNVQHQGREGDGKTPSPIRPKARRKSRRPVTKGRGKAHR